MVASNLMVCSKTEGMGNKRKPGQSHKLQWASVPSHRSPLVFILHTFQQAHMTEVSTTGTAFQKQYFYLVWKQSYFTYQSQFPLPPILQYTQLIHLSQPLPILIMSVMSFVGGPMQSSKYLDGECSSLGSQSPFFIRNKHQFHSQRSYKQPSPLY